MAGLSLVVHLGVHPDVLRSHDNLAGSPHRKGPHLRHQVSLHTDARRSRIRRTRQHRELVPRPGARQANRIRGESIRRPCAGNRPRPRPEAAPRRKNQRTQFKNQQQKLQKMKCKAFASQLEAHVGQSPVRGGNHEVGDQREQPIKTDRNTLNNLNQLLSLVKTIFGRKATPVSNTPLEAEPPTGIASVSDPRLRAAFADIEKYLADNYGTPVAKLRYQDYTNGATLVSEDSTFYLSLAILTEPDGLYNLPDNVMLLVAVTSTNDTDWLAAELRKFTNFLMQLCPKHRIQHLAFAFSKESSACRLRSKNPDHPATVKVNGLPLAQQEPDITCIRLY